MSIAADRPSGSRFGGLIVALPLPGGAAFALAADAAILASDAGAFVIGTSVIGASLVSASVACGVLSGIMVAETSHGDTPSGEVISLENPAGRVAVAVAFACKFEAGAGCIRGAAESISANGWPAGGGEASEDEGAGERKGSTLIAAPIWPGRHRRHLPRRDPHELGAVIAQRMRLQFWRSQPGHAPGAGHPCQRPDVPQRGGHHP